MKLIKINDPNKIIKDIIKYEQWLHTLPSHQVEYKQPLHQYHRCFNARSINSFRKIVNASLYILKYKKYTLFWYFTLRKFCINMSQYINDYDPKSKPHLWPYYSSYVTYLTELDTWLNLARWDYCLETTQENKIVYNYDKQVSLMNMEIKYKEYLTQGQITYQSFNNLVNCGIMKK